MAAFWEIAARSVSTLFFLYFVCLKYLFISRFGFGSWICIFNCSGSCSLLFYYFYKNSGIAVNDNWYQDVTESAEETVKEFLCATSKQTNSQNKNQVNIDASITAKDWTETGYDSDHYCEVDANDQAGNVGTLVDDADIENKYDQVFTFAPGEGQHQLCLYLVKDAEYLCFPSIFCGNRRPENEDWFEYIIVTL